MAEEITIRPAVVKDASALRDLRLEALQNHPEAFGSDHETESQRGVSETEERLRDDMGATFVAEANSHLAGMAGIGRYRHKKTRHNATIWGVYIRPEWRGRGILDRLMEACSGWAAKRNVEMLKLAVVSTNVAAINGYLRAGFRIYGVEPRVLLLNGVYYDEFLMVKDL